LFLWSFCLWNNFRFMIIFRLIIVLLNLRVINVNILFWLFWLRGFFWSGNLFVRSLRWLLLLKLFTIYRLFLFFLLWLVRILLFFWTCLLIIFMRLFICLKLFLFSWGFLYILWMLRLNILTFFFSFLRQFHLMMFKWFLLFLLNLLLATLRLVCLFLINSRIFISTVLCFGDYNLKITLWHRLVLKIVVVQGIKHMLDSVRWLLERVRLREWIS